MYLPDDTLSTQIEQFGWEAIQLFFAEGLKLKLYGPEVFDIIKESLEQQAKAKMVTQVQEHLDEHFTKGQLCPELKDINERFETKREDNGRIIVVRFKEEKERLN